MFKHNLQDLVKGIRAHKGETQAKYVAKEIVAIKDELKMPEARVKVSVCAPRPRALTFPSPLTRAALAPPFYYRSKRCQS